MTRDHSFDDGQPTQTSTVLVVLASIVTAAALVRAADVVWPAVVGAVGAVMLAVGIWASGWDRYRAVGSALASVLVLPVGIGIVAATVGTVLVLAGSLFPVPSATAIPETAIRLSARAMVVTGAVTAVFGATTATRGALDTDTVERAATSSVRTAVLPLLAAMALAGSAVLRYLESSAAGPGVDSLIGDVLRAVTGIFFEPDPLGPHLPTFVLLAGVTLLATHRGVRALPLSELLAETGERSELQASIERGQRWLFFAGIAVLTLLPIAALLQIAAPPRRLRSIVGPGVYDLVASVTTNPALRSLAWWLILAGASIAVGVWLLRRFVQHSADRIGSVIAPFASGLTVVGLAFLAAERVLTAAIAWVASKLPGQFGTTFETVADSVVEVYGPATIVLSATAATLVLVAMTLTALWMALATRYVEERTAGITIASLALFNAAAFAGVLDVSTALVLAALVGAVVVWDAGEFGVTLGKEIGRRASTRRAEFVHTTGTVAVGGFGAGVAVLLADVSIGPVSSGTGPVALALVAVLGGLLLLVAALR